MHYVILKEGNWYVVRSKSSAGNYGPAKGHHRTREAAEEQRQALKAGEEK